MRGCGRVTINYEATSIGLKYYRSQCSIASLSDGRIDQLPHLDTHGMDLHKLSGWDE